MDKKNTSGITDMKLAVEQLVKNEERQFAAEVYPKRRLLSLEFIELVNFFNKSARVGNSLNK